MARGNVWSREETMMAFALYFLLGPSEIDKDDGESARFAKLVHRGKRSVAMKLWNIASLDRNRQALGKAGLPHAANLEKEMWARFNQQGDTFLEECFDLLARLYAEDHVEQSALDELGFTAVSIQEGKERERLSMQRVNQAYFRKIVLENYENRCCITGLAVKGLLVASHIKPWSASDPVTERLDSKNGLLLNALHDRAFDSGYITLDDKLSVVVSKRIPNDEPAMKLLRSYEGRRISMPVYSVPKKEYLEYHNDVIFLG